jgi:hypothetical protein
MKPYDVSADPPESRDSLWLLVIAPCMWAVHLLLCYITAAVWCEKVAGPDGSLGGVRTAIAVYTAVALPAIVLVGWTGYRRHMHAPETLTRDRDSPGDRHRFLGFAMLLLSGLSAIAVLYAAFASAFFTGCR